MKIELNKVYAWGDTYARVADINGSEITFSNGAITNAENLYAVLPAGSVFNEIEITEDIEGIDEDTVIGGMPVIQYNNVRLCSGNHKVNDKLLNEAFDFLKEERYQPQMLALAKILGEWRRNKLRLKKVLSASPVWNQEALGLVWHIEVPDHMKRNEAERIYDEIMNAYYAAYQNDYRHCVHYAFDEFLKIDDQKSKEFKSCNIKIAVGMKPSRAIRKYFEAVGVHRITDFEKLYAKLSDALSEKPLKRTVVLSIHPMDYLRMSYGNSWVSCHNIGDRGCYHNGTLSYLMDESAMVLTLLPETFVGETFMQPKINRMMFFLNEEGDILQSRLYPQTRIPELEAILAHEVAEKIKEALKIEGEYKKVAEDTWCDNYVWSLGEHYHDYNCSGYGQNIWSVRQKPKQFKIGHPGVCITCGGLNTKENSLACDCGRRSSYQSVSYACPNSGRQFDSKKSMVLNPADGKYYLETYVCPECGAVHFDKNEIYCPECRKTHKMTCDCGSEEIYIVYEGKAYCKDCAAREFAFCEDCGKLERRRNMREYDDQIFCIDCIQEYEEGEPCECCGEYHSTDDMYYVEDYGYICYDCRENGDFYYCRDCDELHHIDDMVCVGDEYVCQNCIDRHYYRCEECGEYVYEGDAEWVDDSPYCPDCIDEYFERCEECGDYVLRGDAEEYDGEYYCRDCFDSKFAECAECGEVYPKSEMKYIEDEDKWVCEDCLEAESDTEKQFGLLTKTLDGRFREGDTVVVKDVKDEEILYRIELVDSQAIYRYVDKAYIKLIEETISA